MGSKKGKKAAKPGENATKASIAEMETEFAGEMSFEAGEISFEPVGKKRKAAGQAPVSAKRAEQNRIAQRNFREKQLQKQREMSSKLEMFERIQDENLMVNLELNALKLEKENMIHLMDKLRSENMVLYDTKSSLEKKLSSHSRPAGQSGRTTSQLQQQQRYIPQPVVKGNFGLITRPPPARSMQSKIIIPPWTSHKNTFIDSATSSSNTGGGGDTGSVSTSTHNEKDSLNAEMSPSIEVAAISPLHSQPASSSSSTPYPVDNNNYPGYPSWTPPTLAWKQPSVSVATTAVKEDPGGAENQKSRRKSGGVGHRPSVSSKAHKEALDREKRLPPNPLPYHLSFSYTDTKTSHNTFKPPDIVVQPPSNECNLDQQLQSAHSAPCIIPGTSDNNTNNINLISDPNFNAFLSLFSAGGGGVAPSFPLQQQQQHYMNSMVGNNNHGNGTGILPFASTIPTPQFPAQGQLMQQQQQQQPLYDESRPLWMPFMPSTNAMTPLFHHIPFESLGTGAGVSSNSAADNLLFSAENGNLSFGPMQFSGSSSGSAPLDSNNDDAAARLMNVFLPM